MIEILDLSVWLTQLVKERIKMTGTGWVKTLLMAAGAAAWGVLVNFFHGVAATSDPFTMNFHPLIMNILSAVVPAVIAFFFNPPHAPTK